LNRVDRLLALILYLQSRRVATAEMMAEHFGLSIRTIYRDMAALAEAGVPVVAEAGAGYRLMKGYLLPPVNFSEQEAMALSTALLLAQRTTSANYTQLMQSALDKITAVLPNDGKDRLNHLVKAMAAPFSQPPPAADLTLLQRAITHQHLVRLHYRDASWQLSERDVEPAGLIYYLGRWHFIGWCRLRQDWRDFRTDRIHQLELLAEKTQARPDFSAQQFLQQHSPDSSQTAVVRFSTIAADRAKREWWHGIAGEQHHEGGTELELYCADWRSLASWLMSFGQMASVIEPLELKQEVIRQSQQLLALYQGELNSESGTSETPG